MPAVSMEEQAPSVAKAISPTRSDYVRAEARTLQRLCSVVSGVAVDRVRSYFCSPARDEVRVNGVWPIHEKRSLVIMTDMNGIDAAITIRTMLPKCKILLFSGQAATADLLDRARSQGHEFEILAKPVHPQDLLARLRS
jgi:hypothetical protein